MVGRKDGSYSKKERKTAVSNCFEDVHLFVFTTTKVPGAVFTTKGGATLSVEYAATESKRADRKAASHCTAEQSPSSK
jgi:hypothetical protein